MSGEWILPPSIAPQSEEWSIEDEMTATHTPFFAPGLEQRVDRGGQRLKGQIAYVGLRQSDRHVMQAAVQALRGRVKPFVYVMSATPRRGELSIAELAPALTTAGYSPSVSSAVVAIDDGLRIKAIENTGANANVLRTGALPVTQYACYALRVHLHNPHGTSVNIGAGTSATGQQFGGSELFAASTYYATSGYRVAPIFINAGSVAYINAAFSASTYTAGDAIDLRYVSLTRCLLVDGSPNRVLYSDDLSNAVWFKQSCSVSINDVAPDGASDAYTITENTTTGSHYVTQSYTKRSASETNEYAVSAYVKANGRANGFLYFIDGSGARGGVYFDLTAQTAATYSTGTAITNIRTFIYSAGNGWFRVGACMRLTNTGNALGQVVALLADSGGVAGYTGNGTSGLRVWRVALQDMGNSWQGGIVPSRGVQTTSAILEARTQRSGFVRIKGGRSLIEGGLTAAVRAGDWLEIGGFLYQAQGDLDIADDGTGALQIAPDLVVDTPDNTPIILHKPAGRFRLNSAASFNSQFGLYSDLTLNIEELYL